MNSLAFSVKYELTLDYLSKRLTNIASKPMEGDIESESIFDVVDFELNAGLLQFDCYEQILSLYSKSEDLTILIP